MTLEEMAIKTLFIIIMNIMAIFGNAQMMTANQGYNILKQMMFVDEHSFELSTRSEISTFLIFDLFKLQLVGKFSIDWKIVHFFNEDGFECIERCVWLCLEGLRWVTRPLGRNCRGNLEVFLLRKLILWEQPDLHIIISVDFLLLQNI